MRRGRDRRTRDPSREISLTHQSCSPARATDSQPLPSCPEQITIGVSGQLKKNRRGRRGLASGHEGTREGSSTETQNKNNHARSFGHRNPKQEQLQAPKPKTRTTSSTETQNKNLLNSSSSSSSASGTRRRSHTARACAGGRGSRSGSPPDPGAPRSAALRTR